MIGAFGYLLSRSLRNRVARQLRRLRQPRYLVALGLGLTYLYLLLFHQRPGASAGRAPAGWVELAGAMTLALAVAWAWLFAAERRVLAFSPAEVTFLFPAPVTRRQLVHFKLVRSQLVVLFNTLLWTLLLSRERFGASGGLRAISLWAVLTTLSLHRLGASFVRASLAEHGRAGARRRAVSLAVVAGVLVATGWAALDARTEVAAAWEEGIGPLLSALAVVAQGPIPTGLLYPFRLVVASLAAPTTEAWLHAMVPALAILGAHYVWVIRSDAAFQAAAVEESLRRAQRAEGRRPRRASADHQSRPFYRLRARGAPAGAILWKNLTAVARTGRPRTTALFLAAAGAALAALSFRPGSHLAEIVGWFAAVWAGFLIVVGPQWVRSDLRGDLPKLDLLRTYPVTGRAVVAAEVAASTVVLTALQLGVGGVAYLAFLGNESMDPDLAGRTAILAAAAVLLPAVNVLGLLIQNGAALLLPSWVHLGPGRSGGVEALGQNMLAIIAHLLVLAAALVLPVAAATAVILTLEPRLGAWALVPAMGVAVLVVAGEALLAVGWLGRLLDRTDPVAALSA